MNVRLIETEALGYRYWLEFIGTGSAPDTDVIEMPDGRVAHIHPFIRATRDLHCKELDVLPGAFIAGVRWFTEKRAHRIAKMKQTQRDLRKQLGLPGAEADDYVDRAWVRIDRLSEVHDPRDREVVTRLLYECYDDGFEIADAVKYARATEHVNPDLSEEKALKRMAVIRAKYPDSLHKKGGTK